MKQPLTLLLLFVFSFSLKAQHKSETTLLVPFKIEKTYLSGLEIPQLQLEAHPERRYFQKRLYKGSELSVYILSSETAVNEINNFGIDEFVYYLNGRADIQIEQQEPITFYAGDYIIVPKGFSGTWTNNGGNTYHLELSVISNQRADSSLVSTAKAPFLLDKAIRSGIGLTQIDSMTYRDIFYAGLELIFFSESEKPTEKHIVNKEKEEFIHILNGMVRITSEGGKEQRFYAGDFFILPKGFTGSWKSEGQNLFRTIRVVSSL